MARFMIGTDGFEYQYIVSRKSVDLSLLARASGIGELMFAVEYLVTFQDGQKEAVPWAELKRQTALGDAGPGVYEAPPSEEPQNAFEVACVAEQARVPALLALFPGLRAVRVELRARALYRIARSDWGRMVEWLNAYLPGPLRITEDSLKSFDLKALELFNPDEDGEGDLGTGTRAAAFLYAANAERYYLPYLTPRILTHAVQHDLVAMTVEETDRLWRGMVWEAT
jgi:hypothetical protein